MGGFWEVFGREGGEGVPSSPRVSFAQGPALWLRLKVEGIVARRLVGKGTGYRVEKPVLFG